jgi:SAM-dependent methyltransferase
MDAAEWDERYRSAELVWGSEPNLFVRQQCEGLAVGEGLDLACGEGRNALWLARRGWTVTGVDYSAAAIERAESLTAREPAEVADRLTWRVADITLELPPPSSVDLVLISYLHLAPVDQEAVFASASAAVRPRGHLVVVGHDLRNIAEGVGGPQDASRLHTPERVATVAAAAGLTVELAETVERPTSAGVALDTLVRARRPARPGVSDARPATR